MIKINRLKILIKTDGADYCFDEKFNSGLNFIASDYNTMGKSSIIIAIYYALGVEKIIGGTNEKALTSVYKTKIEDGNTSFDVIESDVYLEVEGPHGIATLYRAAKHANRDSKLITVYFSKLCDIYKQTTLTEDYYVNMQDSATSQKGFHTFLERFMGLELPLVPAVDGIDRKLYIQLIFSAFFIEQKNGWSGIYSGMPYLGIKDSKKRVTEYILGLSEFENDRKRSALLNQEKYQKEKWKDLYEQFCAIQRTNQCIVTNISNVPELPNSDKEKEIKILCAFQPSITVDEWIEDIQKEQEKLKTLRPKVIDNYDSIDVELTNTEEMIEAFDESEKKIQDSIRSLERKKLGLEKSLHTILEDISNNKDASKLQRLGSDLNYDSYNGCCPTCHQKIEDSLLDFQQGANIMSVEETINHLNAQKDLISYAIENYKENLMILHEKLNCVRTEKASMIRLAKALRNDLYTVDEDYSETIIYKRMDLERKIESLEEFKVEVQQYLTKFDELRNDWKKIQTLKAELPKKGMSEEDLKRINQFTNNFVKNLKSYNYFSIQSIENIEISKDGYMPVIDDFDMKFDSSASDNIRAIWAYTMALTQTADENLCDKPGIMIFDEPAQHSIGADDLKAFLDSVLSLGPGNQTIIGITMNSRDVRDTIQKLDVSDYKMIQLHGRAFKRI